VGGVEPLLSIEIQNPTLRRSYYGCTSSYWRCSVLSVWLITTLSNVSDVSYSGCGWDDMHAGHRCQVRSARR